MFGTIYMLVVNLSGACVLYWATFFAQEQGSSLEGEGGIRFNRAVDLIQNYLTKKILGTLRKEDVEFMECPGGQNQSIICTKRKAQKDTVIDNFPFLLSSKECECCLMFSEIPEVCEKSPPPSPVTALVDLPASPLSSDGEKEESVVCVGEEGPTTDPEIDKRQVHLRTTLCTLEVLIKHPENTEINKRQDQFRTTLCTIKVLIKHPENSEINKKQNQLQTTLCTLEVCMQFSSFIHYSAYDVTLSFSECRKGLLSFLARFFNKKLRLIDLLLLMDYGTSTYVYVCLIHLLNVIQLIHLLNVNQLIYLLYSFIKCKLGKTNPTID